MDHNWQNMQQGAVRKVGMTRTGHLVNFILFFVFYLYYSRGQPKPTNRLSGWEVNVSMRFFQN